jgi:uncharacterized membrane protein YdjX (TVP38/TMEM64 family)
MTGAGEAEAPRSVGVAARLGLVCLVVLVLVLAQRLGVFQALGAPAELAARLVALGAWGWLSFVVAYALLQPFGVPGTVFVFAAPLIWPWHVAFGLSMTGTMAASVVGFSFSRFVARDWIGKRVPLRFAKYEQRLADRGFATVALLRFVFWMPPLLHAFFGVSRVGFWTHFWGSLVGYVVPLLLVSIFGEKIFHLMRGASASTWVAVLAGAVVTGALVWGVRRIRMRRAR